MSALPPKADIAFYGARRAKGWRWRNANTYGLRDRRRDRSRYPQRHSMASRNAAAARAERVFRWVRPRDARDVYCGLALRISPRRPLIALPV
jgi:hypothetical protein